MYFFQFWKISITFRISIIDWQYFGIIEKIYHSYSLSEKSYTTYQWKQGIYKNLYIFFFKMCCCLLVKKWNGLNLNPNAKFQEKLQNYSQLATATFKGYLWLLISYNTDKKDKPNLEIIHYENPGLRVLNNLKAIRQEMEGAL